MEASCPDCRAHFQYQLIHNGFNDSSYAYCGKCGATALCSHRKWPEGLPPSDYGPLLPEQVECLRPCSCGGYFHTHAMPRCPACGNALDPLQATSWIEAVAPGTASGLRWQASWLGLYALAVESKVLNDPWARDSGESAPAD